jgi:hypothetical protein
VATSLDQLEQLNALFRPLGSSIADYGQLKFQLAEQEKERAAKLRLIQANR